MRSRSILITLICVAPACVFSVHGLDVGEGNAGADDGVHGTPDGPSAPMDGALADAQVAALDAALDLSDAKPSDGAVVRCGAASCAAPNICCLRGSPPSFVKSCEAADACTGLVAACDGPEDCAAGVCCGGAGPPGGGAAACAAGETCTRVLCHADADCAAAGGHCCDYGFSASVCASQCPGS